MKKFLFIWLPVLLILAALVYFGIYWIQQNNDYRIGLTLNGQASITLEYGQQYSEPGADAEAIRRYFSTGPQRLPVTISGVVDVTQLGTYVLKYTAQIQEHKATKKRSVTIVDTQAPEITLVGDAEITILPDTEFVDPGYVATDNYDGDITEKVKTTMEGEIVTYTIADSSGNTATATRRVRVVDTEPPELALQGGSTVEVNVGGYYLDPGYHAMDPQDGNLTDKVKVKGAVDTFTTGTYKLTYYVSDESGNQTKVSRKVKVVNPGEITVGEPNGKNIYLTFDDGPGPYTQELLDVLDKYDIKATFFVIATPYNAALKRMAEEGHSVGMHAYSHTYSTIYRSTKAYLKDFRRIEKKINKHTGLTPNIFRFPGGSSNTVSTDYSRGIMTKLTKQMTDKGYVYFDWNVDSNDAGGASSAETVFKNVTAGIAGKQNSVVLQHDIKGFSVDAVEDIILWGIENGYRFLPLDENSPTCQHDVNN